MSAADTDGHGRPGSPTPGRSTLGQRTESRRRSTSRRRPGSARRACETGRQSRTAASALEFAERPDHDHRGEQRTVDRRREGVPRRRGRSDEQQRADWAIEVAGALSLQNGASVSTSTTNYRQRRPDRHWLVDLDQGNVDGGAQLSVGGTLTNSGTNDVGAGQQHAVGGRHGHGGRALQHRDDQHVGQLDRAGDARTSRRRPGSARRAWRRRRQPERRQALLEFDSGQITTIAANSELSIAGANCVPRRRDRSDEQQRADWAFDGHGPLYLYDGASISTSTTNYRKRRPERHRLVDLDQGNLDGGAQLSVGGTLTNSGTIDNAAGQQHAGGGRHGHGGRALQHRDDQPVGELDEQATLDVPAPAGFGTAGVLSGDGQSEQRQSAARIRERPDHDHRGEQRTVDRRREGVPRRRDRPDEQQRADWAFDGHGLALSLRRRIDLDLEGEYRKRRPDRHRLGGPGSGQR